MAFILATVATALLAGLGSTAAVEKRNVLEARSITQRDVAYPCNGGPWAGTMNVGGDSGNPMQCESRYGGDYSPITGMEVWQWETESIVSAIRFHYASGDPSQIWGTSNGSPQTIDLAPGQTWSDCQLYGNGKGQYLGHIHLETSDQTEFDGGGPTDGITSYPASTGGGIMYGAAFTLSDDDQPLIENLNFLFLGQRVSSISVTDVTYTQDPTSGNSGIQPNSNFNGTWYNSLTTNATFAYGQSFGVSQSYSYEQSSTTTFGLSNTLSFSAEVFEIGVSDSLDTSWSSASSSATTTASSTSTAVTCSATGTVVPNSGVQVTGTFQTGNATFDYTSTVTVNLEDGTSFSYQEGGQLVNSAYTECNTDIKPDNDPTLQDTNSLSAVAGATSSSSASSTASSTASSSGSTASTRSRSSVTSTSASSSASSTGSSPARITSSASAN